MDNDGPGTRVSDDLELATPFMVVRRSNHRKADRRVCRFYFQVPSRYLQQGCDVPSSALGDQLDRANASAKLMYAAFVRWKQNRDAVQVERRPPFGTFDWLVGEYMRTDHFLSRSAVTRKTYKGHLRLFGDSVFPAGELAGRRLGDVRLDRLTRPRIGSLVEALHVTKQIDFGGTMLTVRCGGRVRDFVSTASTMWNRMSVKIEYEMLGTNPFEKHKIEQHEKENLAATLDETETVVAAADELGLSVVGTIALTCFELRWRPAHVIDLFNVKHYRPPDHPDEVLILDSKTMQAVWRPLLDDDGGSLYPVLVERLDALKGDRVDGPMFNQGQVLGERAPTPGARIDMDLLRKRIDKVVAHVGGRKLTLTTFRHGGITEMAEASLTPHEMMAHTQHQDPRTLTDYFKKTATIQRKGQMSVLKHRGKRKAANARRALRLAGAVASETAQAIANTGAAASPVAPPRLTWGYGTSWKVTVT